MKSKYARAVVGAALAWLSLGAQAQVYTGVQGSGWREVYMPLASSTVANAQQVGTYTTRNALLIEIDDANGLSNAPIPQAAKDNILLDGFGTGTLYVDRDVVQAIADGTASQKFGQYIEPDSTTAYNSSEGREVDDGRNDGRVTPQGIFCRSGWRTYTLSRRIDFSSIAASKSIAGGSLSFDGRMGGSADVQISVEYKKSDWSLCIPYTVRFKEARASGMIDLNDARLALTASVSSTIAESSNRHDLYKSDGLFWLGPIPVWYTYAVPLDYGYKVILNASASVDYSSQLRGNIVFDYVCRDGQCSGASDTSTVQLLNTTPNWGLQADATFDPFVKVGLEGRLYPIGSWYLASAGVGFKFSAPLQVYAYYGNACGDGDNNGSNETVNTYFADLQARVSLVTSWSVLGRERVRYISSGGWGARKLNGALFKVLNTEDNHIPLWSRRLYYTDSGAPSIFSPVLRQQTGVPNGSQYEHVLRASMRPCVPFEGTYVVNMVDPNGQSLPVTVASRTATTTTRLYNTSPTWRLYASGVRDDDGRVFSNSSTVAPVLDPPPPPPAGTGQFALVSRTRTTPGSSGDMVTVTIRNAGTQLISGIVHGCSGGSFHVWGNGPTTLAAGQSGTYQCRAAASGYYAWPTFTVSGSGASNSPFSPNLN